MNATRDIFDVYCNRPDNVINWLTWKIWHILTVLIIAISQLNVFIIHWQTMAGDWREVTLLVVSMLSRVAHVYILACYRGIPSRAAHTAMRNACNSTLFTILVRWLKHLSSIKIFNRVPVDIALDNKFLRSNRIYKVPVSIIERLKVW